MSSGSAPQLTATNSRDRRGPSLWIELATSSLPVPPSPWDAAEDEDLPAGEERWQPSRIDVACPQAFHLEDRVRDDRGLDLPEERRDALVEGFAGMDVVGPAAVIGDDAVEERATSATGAIRLNPRYAVAYDSRGLLKKRMNDRAGAKSDFDLAIEADPGKAEPRLHRAELSMEEGDLAAALPDFESAKTLDPASWKAWGRYGQVLAGLGKKEEGIAALERARELAPRRRKAEVEPWLAEARR